MAEHKDKEWLVVDLLKTATDMFSERKTGEPRLSAELLLGHVLRLKRLDLYLNHDRPVSGTELDAFRECCRLRLQGRPVQYIAGEAFFYGGRFLVDERVLIPRPETELVLEHSMERLKASGRPEGVAPSILDIGTGSGCIAITLALRIPEARLTAVDVSPEALQLAEQNAALHGVADRIRFLTSDALDASFADRVGGPFDLVISNPPYIPEAEWMELQEEVRLYEPRLALVAPRGFEYYTSIASVAPQLLTKGGVLCFELHADAASGVRALLETAGFSHIELVKDYSGHDRAMSAIAGNL
jgi:release factor glutamine methyltransferase